MAGLDIGNALKLHNNADLIYRHTVSDEGVEPASREDIRNSLGESVDFKIIKVGESAALVTGNPETKEITVSFSPSDSSGVAKFWGDEHPLGGEVYTGIYNSLLAEDENGFFIDQVKETVNDYSKDMGGGAPLDLSGFSKGGSLAVGAVAQWMAERLPEESGIKIRDLVTFGSPPFGDEKFCEEFDKHSERLGINYWRITGVKNDPVPTLLTDEGPWYAKPFGRALYDHPETSHQWDSLHVDGHSMDEYKDALLLPDFHDVVPPPAPEKETEVINSAPKIPEM
jgi:hypothetical protein